MKCLTLHFLNRNFTVRIPNTKLMHEGSRCNALILFTSCRILISRDVAPEHRFIELIHELRHAWVGHGGLPADEECDARDVSLFCETALRSLHQAGGIKALMALRPHRLDLDEMADMMLAVKAIQNPRAMNSICVGEIGSGGRIKWRAAR